MLHLHPIACKYPTKEMNQVFFFFFFFFFLKKENASGVDRILQEPRLVPRKVRGVTPDTLKSQDFPSQNLSRHLDSAVGPH
jgi:hypothetical protein